MHQQLTVTKRDGRTEPLELSKFHRVCAWACENITGVAPSAIELASQIQFYDKIKTSAIHETLIKAAAELITVETPNYQYVASRLINYALRKEVYQKYEPEDLMIHVHNIVAAGYYDRELLFWYDADEYEWLNKQLDHERDYLIPYCGMEQFRGKYLVKNRVTGQFFETPQMAYMLIAMTLFHKYPKETRLGYVKDYYDAISTFDISLPTPIMAGLRTPQRQYSSCVLIESDDSLDSINATTSSIVKYVSQKAGIGVGVGRIRALGSQIRGGDASHTGMIPFMKLFSAAVHSCSQGGVRGGAATFHYPLWHFEIEDLLVLKNNKGVEGNRIRHVDYSVQMNKVMYERLLQDGHITLFSPHDVPEMYQAFFTDVDKFRKLYEAAERNPSLRKKRVSAVELFTALMQERKDTGRIYIMNVDHTNDHGAFVKERAPIRMSNLCQEIALPTIPLNSMTDMSGEIALCILTAINWGKIKNPEDFKRPCELAVRALNALIDYQHYPVFAAEKATKSRRPIGVGIVNLAYWMAKNDIPYDGITKEQLQKIHRFAEAWSYYLIKASADLAAEETRWTPILKLDDTKYSQGIVPIDTYKKSVDELVDPIYEMPWAELRGQLRATGILNSTLMALMPAETSAQISNSTNGIEPPRALVSVKVSKDGVLAQVVPEVRRLKNKYNLLWDQKSPEGYLKICAVLQKFIDQAISVNTSYNPKHYGDQLDMQVLIEDLVTFYKYGGKHLYYFNTNDSAGEQEVRPLPQAVEQDDEDCEACKI